MDNPVEAYSEGNGYHFGYVEITSYSGPGSFGGSGPDGYFTLPNQADVIIFQINGCVEGFYTIGGIHYSTGSNPSSESYGSSYSGGYVEDYECDYFA